MKSCLWNKFDDWSVSFWSINFIVWHYPYLTRKPNKSRPKTWTFIYIWRWFKIWGCLHSYLSHLWIWFDAENFDFITENHYDITFLTWSAYMLATYSKKKIFWVNPKYTHFCSRRVSNATIICCSRVFV